MCLAITGCTPNAPIASPEPTIVQSANPAPTPSQVPSATKPAIGDLVVYPGGIDYVKVGVVVEERPEATAIVQYNTTPCFPDDPNLVTGWEASYASEPFSLVSNPDGTVRGILVFDPAINSDHGFHVGSSGSDIAAGYGSEIVLDSTGFTDLYTASGPEGLLVYELATDRDSEMSGKVPGTVMWMLILGPGSTPFSVYRAGYGTCA